MQLAGSRSWAISISDPPQLLFALYLRDTCGLTVQMEPPIPPLEPQPTHQGHAPLSSGVASRQWEAWWVQLVEGGGFWPEHVAPSDFAKVRNDPDVERLFYWPLLYAAPDYPGLDASPELQELARRHHAPGSSWISERRLQFAELERDRSRRRLDPEGDIVRSMEGELDRPIRPFRLDVRVLAVAGSDAWHLSANRAMVTIAMWKNLDAYADWLRPVVQALA